MQSVILKKKKSDHLLFMLKVLKLSFNSQINHMHAEFQSHTAAYWKTTSETGCIVCANISNILKRHHFIAKYIVSPTDLPSQDDFEPSVSENASPFAD